MFFTIFKHELTYWFKKPAIYIYAAIFFLLALVLSASSAGIFDSLTVTTGSSKIVNSPSAINGMFNTLAIFLFFLFPSIIGSSVYRDYKSNMHSILYSYPFNKANYLSAKFLSSFLIVLLIILIAGLGLFFGFRLPGTNSEIVGAFNFSAYLHSYLIYIIPNVLLFGVIVFGVVTFSRNIAAGFITVLLLMFVQGVADSLLSNPDNRFWSALFDPFGGQAANYYTRYWTVAEQNELILPFKGVIIYNRLLWLGIASLILAGVYKLFSFSQNAFTFSFKKSKGERIIKQNFGGITRIELPKVNYDYSFINDIKTTWKLSNIDFKYIITSLPFISILLVGLIFILLTAMGAGELFGTKTYPTTWQMLLIPGNTFSLFINLMTFLYAGMLVHRASIAGANHIIDVTPVKNWALLLSKFAALLKMQLVMLAVIVVAGVLFQIYKGYYNFELGHYFFEVYALKFIHFVIWAMLALFIQSLFRNPYLGLFVLLVIAIGIQFLGLAGIEQSIFKYNQGPSYSYSDMNEYGASFSRYYTYKIYWFLGGLVALILAGLFWVRGLPHSFKERLSILKERLTIKLVLGIVVLLLGFFSLGSRIYYENNVLNIRKSSKEREQLRVTWEKEYKKYEGKAQPRIVAVNVDMNIFPKTRDFKSSGTYKMINKTNETIDSIFLNHNDYPSTFEFNKLNKLVLEDTIQNFDIYKFNTPIQPGDSLELKFTVHNKPNTFLRSHSPVLANGTFINSGIYPSLGYSSAGELRDDKTREKFDLPKNKLRPHPSDSTALGNTYISGDSDWIDFEATVSTDEDQIAIAPGYLQKEWVKDGRKYFHYKMDSKILNFYAFNSARFEVKRDTWKDVNLEIYYHKGHEFNLERMMEGIKASLDYNSKNFSPYQHRQVRIIEFPRTEGSFAQAFPNTIPFSEAIGFIADVDDTNEGGVDYPFAITVHELAHQWWAHQVIGADVLGATMLSESLSEYVSLKVLEHEYGKSKMRKFLKKSLDGYLQSRTFERKREKPLMYNDGQGYIRYQKGSLVFYALSDYIGEEKLNNALKEYVEKVKFQDAPYTTSIEMVDYIKKATPDSLQYVIKDMFETITLYKNRITKVTSKKLENGKYQVDIDFEVSKYRNDEKGKRYYGEQVGDTLSYKTEKMKKPVLSVKLADYVDIGIFGEEEVDGKKKEVELYLQKHKVTQINNRVSIIVDKKPVEVGVDPYNKLIDTKSDDNRRKL
ncbi:ABC-2 type transport system permease protein [Tenacibaculum sp. MAR_2010_89]|uniref:ABC transporter permease/M1 family aminopeptidase n=1 Tax=Tenacibaculum sp. MAR_2010_89 TaxID=1250198 RepID=UPI000898E8E0|nr:M1 family aminopeptidase [Tenacibaculum sp. MAR_2010_89]SEE35365.1 ABC-2 type transport system permease protein [Tenacibaculum sp. MAR_2010_89]